MTTYPARRTARPARSTGLVAVAAAAAFSLAACQSGDKHAAGQEKKDSVSTSHPTGDGGAPSNSRTTAGKSRTGAQSASLKAAAPVPKEPLADGSTAEIYALGAQHYRAKIVHQGQVLGTMEANQHDDGGVANGVYIVLSTAGVISAHQ
ncbi:hypothetical protein ACF1GT_00880 [Streptomyces sp. NPDC014636]|uniref:hypothetical protein n=1 Tax=Streptomyces sp. NPDC014636 TaxID=3364876 RepID=UPI0036F81976